MKYLRPLCILVILLNGAKYLQAQERTRVSLPVYPSVSFFYDFPQSFGATAGIEIPLKSNHIINSRKEREKSRYLITTTNIGFYSYQLNHKGIFAQQSLGYSYHTSKPFFSELLIGLGLLRTFYDGSVYTVSNNGDIKEHSHFGRWYATTSIATVLGIDWEKKQHPLPFAISVQPSVWIQYPYNSFVLPHLSMQVTMQWHFLSLFKRVTQKEIHRR